MTAPIPEVLNEAEFRIAWAGFLEDRAQRKKKATIRAQELLLKKMKPWGPVKATRALNESVEKGWVGVFEPKDDISKMGLVNERPVTEVEALKRRKMRALSDLDFMGWLDGDLRQQVINCASISEVERVKAERFRADAVARGEW